MMAAGCGARQPQRPSARPAVAPRPASVAMQLERLGALHASRLSFARSLIRRMMKDRWQICCLRFDLDDHGYGTCVYRIRTPESTYSFVVFSQYLEDERRSDRVIADAWDCACALVEGELDDRRLHELQAQVPRQEAGRFGPDVLVLSRANRSMRNFQAVVDALAEGRQPQPRQLTEVGYLYRTTAVYGNGKFGIADYPRLRDRQDLGAPFAAQLFAVYLLRDFSIRQVEHIARRRAHETAVRLACPLRRYLGIGNSTGLGMAPFLITHPLLIAQWVLMRETAIARCLAQPATAACRQRLLELIDRAIQHSRETRVADDAQGKRNRLLAAELGAARAWLADANGDAGHWQDRCRLAEQRWSLETEEMLHTLILELYPEQVDELEMFMGIAEGIDLVPHMEAAELRRLIESSYAWALAIDFGRPQAEYFFWYKSAKKEEPRLGVRGEETGADRELPLDIGRRVQHCHETLVDFLTTCQDRASVAEFLLLHPEQRGIVRRVQNMAGTVMGEIRANLLHRDMLPMHLLRCKLSFFGATKFDPRSSRWVRITLFQGAPLVEDIDTPFADDWALPPAPDPQPSP